MDFKEIKQIADRVGERRGWDFSQMRDERQPVPWDYIQVVRAYLQPTSHVLDIGTGGGERFLELAPYLGKGVGIDADPTMVETACSNLPHSLQNKFTFEKMRQEALSFATATFDVVINRQAPFTVEEVARVLKVEGYFITQQVAETNMQNILLEFGWDINALPQSQIIYQVAKAFEAQGCRVIAQAEYNVRYYVQDLDSLLYWFKAIFYKSATGFPENFDIEKHWQVVARIIDKYQTARGIETNEHRKLLIVQKLIA